MTPEERHQYVVSTVRTAAGSILGVLRDVGPVVALAEAITAALKSGHKLVTFGNGGSAADAQHIAAELVGAFYDRARPGLPALCLNTNVSTLTAIGNDFGYPQLFARQVEAFVTRGDVVLGLTTSGTSSNVILALERARDLGARTAAITGLSASVAADILIRVQSPDTPRVQETTILIGHLICALVEAEFKRA